MAIACGMFQTHGMVRLLKGLACVGAVVFKATILYSFYLKRYRVIKRKLCGCCSTKIRLCLHMCSCVHYRVITIDSGPLATGTGSGDVIYVPCHARSSPWLGHVICHRNRNPADHVICLDIHARAPLQTLDEP